MSAIGDLVALLGGVGGLSSDLIAKAVDLAQMHAEEIGGCRPIIGGLSADTAAERRKAYDRDRQEKIRRAKKDASLTSLLPSSDSQEKKEVIVGRARRDRGHVCPDDLRPSESHFAAGLKENISRPRVEACCEAMKSWSISNSHRAIARKTNWNAALFGWIDREAERTRGKSNGHQSLKGAVAELRLELGGESDGGAGDPPMRDITPASSFAR